MGSVIDRLDGAGTILVSDSSGDEADRLCRGLLSEGAAAGETVLWVSFERSPDECLSACPTADADRVVLSAGGSAADPPAPDVTVDTVSTPSDLTALGIKLSQFLSTTEGEITVCFGSLTALLEHVDLETAFEFLHTVTRQCYDAGARIHFHVDPAAHDDATVATIASLCDAHVAFDRSPAVRVRADAK